MDYRIWTEEQNTDFLQMCRKFCKFYQKTSLATGQILVAKEEHE